MKKIICIFKGHTRGETYKQKLGISYVWHVFCKRCGYEIYYQSPRARLIGKEIQLGFDGK